MPSRHSRDQPTWEEAEAALEAAWDEIECYVLDESAAPAPRRSSRAGDHSPPPRPPTRRGNWDPQSPSGSGTRDRQTGSPGAAGDSRPPSDPHYVTAAVGGMRLNDRGRRRSRPRQVSSPSRRPPLTPLARTGDTSRPPLTPLRMGMSGPSASPQSPAPSRSSGGSSGPHRRLSRRLTSSSGSLGLSRWSTNSSAGSAAPRDPSRPASSSSAARALRAGGRRLSQGLVSMNRVAQGLLGQRKSSYKGCPHHRLELCPPCMFRIVLPGATYDEAGKVVPDAKVDEPPDVARPPAYGRAARFRPLYDRQLRAADPAGAAGDPGGVARLPARYAEPRPGWFVYCARCQLTHLVGAAGPAAAAHHPSHCANAAAERTVALWVDAEPGWHPRAPPRGKYSVYFGRGSRFNLAGEERGFANAAALEFQALARALRHAEHVLHLRRGLVARHGISNSHVFLWGLTRFRLLVFSPLKTLGQWLQTGGPGEAPENVECFLNFDKVNGTPRQTWLDHRQGLDDAIARLAELGVEVSFFPWRTPGYTLEWRMFA